jgi:microcystin degradation protein MlrC
VQHGFEIVPLLWTFAYPGGLVRRQDYELLKAEFLDRARAALSHGPPVDGALLDLHGAMVVEDIDDAETDVIKSLRDLLGPNRPIVATTDLHANHTLRRVAATDAIIGFDTYPHVDMAERGREAAGLVDRIVRGVVRPAMAIRQLPLFWSSPRQATSHPPMDEVVKRVHELERRPGIVAVTVATGFPWADVPAVGASVIVVASTGRVAPVVGVWREAKKRKDTPSYLRTTLTTRGSALRAIPQKSCGLFWNWVCRMRCCCTWWTLRWPSKPTLPG